MIVIIVVTSVALAAFTLVAFAYAVAWRFGSEEDKATIRQLFREVGDTWRQARRLLREAKRGRR